MKRTNTESMALTATVVLTLMGWICLLAELGSKLATATVI